MKGVFRGPSPPSPRLGVLGKQRGLLRDKGVFMYEWTSIALWGNLPNVG